MSKIAVAAPSWQALQRSESLFPDGMSVSKKPLHSKRIPVRGRRQYGNAALIDAHWPEDHLESCRAPYLAYILSGNVAFPLGGYTLHCKPGHGVLVPPGVAHSDGSHLFLDESVPNNVSCKMFKIRAYNGGLECWLSHTQNGKHWSHRSAEESCRIPSLQAVFYLETLTEEVLAHRVGHQKIENALLIALINVLTRELQEAPKLLPALTGQFGSKISLAKETNPIAQAEEFICSHLGESLTLNRVARHIYMSERSFSHQFRQGTGQSFMEYLSERRYKEAAHLLRSTDWSIEQIAHFVGVKPGRLRILFHQRVGKSPRLFRQMENMRDRDD